MLLRCESLMRPRTHVLCRAASPGKSVPIPLLLRAHRAISDILFAVHSSFFPRVLLLAAAVSVLLVFPATSARPLPQEAFPPAPAPPQQASPSLAPDGPVIVLDPAHGGTDSGARGENGIVEKDLVLQIARAVRAELQRQGYTVVMTRDDDSNPSYDDRTAVANARRNVIFVSFHVGSTGTANTVRAYYDQFWTPIPSPVPAADAGAAKPNALMNTLTPWPEAQRPYADASHRLADLLQIQLAQFFPGSPVQSTGAAVRALRSVAAPAVACEISSVTIANPNSLNAAGAPLATAILHSIIAFRSATPAGAR
jgi:N-acetylmuramoyl-L-alanine amidase